MSLEEILEELYKLEQHVRLQCFWDNDWEAQINWTEISPIIKSSGTRSLEECKDWLLDQLLVLKSFPWEWENK